MSRVYRTPTETSRSGWLHATCLQPATAIERPVSTTCVSAASAPGSGAESSCSSHSHGASRLATSTARTRASPGPPTAPTSTTRASSPASVSCVRSQVSSASLHATTTSSGARVCAASAARVSGRNARSEPTTTTAVTRAREGRLMKTGAGRAGSDDPVLELLQPAPLALRQAAPDPEALVVHERVLQALDAHLARRADALGLARRTTLLREERLGVGLRAQRALLPPEDALVLARREQRCQGGRGAGLRRDAT